MKRAAKIRIASFSAAFLLVLGGCLLDAHLMLDSAAARLEHTYQRALNDLTDYVSGMSAALQKSAYVNTPALRSSVSAQLLEQSGGAKAAMAALPFSQEKTDRISRFLSQVGDYALFLDRKTLSGSSLEEGDLSGLNTLKEYSETLADALAEIQEVLQAENASIGRTESLLNNVDEIESLSLLDRHIDMAATEFAEFPSLLYDGPFSDHVSQRVPRFLQGKPEISPEEARKKAAAFAGCDPSELTEQGEGGERIAVYVFTGKTCRITVTKAGGEIAYFRKTGNYPNSFLSEEEALEKAAQVLHRAGIEEFRESYYVTNDNQYTVNFEAVDRCGTETVLCYPDLIKVTVERETGSAIEYDAAGYLMNHRARALEGPALSADDAWEHVSPALTEKGRSLALIPTPGAGEVLCWEFLCEDRSGGEVLLYLNGDTGNEEELFLLRRDDHGVLVQ